jgi:hypothetical protein
MMMSAEHRARNTVTGAITLSKSAWEVSMLSTARVFSESEGVTGELERLCNCVGGGAIMSEWNGT